MEFGPYAALGQDCSKDGILKQVSAFRLCCMQAYADGLAAKHFVIWFRRSKCLAARPSAYA